MKYKTDLAIAFLLFGALIRKVSAPGENFAFIIKKFPQYTFVSCYRRKTNVFFVVDTAIYQKIRKLSWTCSNGYIRTTEKKPRYLQRYIFPDVGDDYIIHHKFHLFVYCLNWLESMTRKDHPQKRTYTDAIYTLRCDNYVSFFRSLGL